MLAPKLPTDEAGRLEALRRYELFDSPHQQSLDDLTTLAAHICGAPVSLISFVDEHRQWFKSAFGFSGGDTPREISFCGHAILSDELFIVGDATEDTRFADNPLVLGPQAIRFYAGAPIISPDGYVLGTLCVIDRVPRQLTAEQENALRVLSRQVMAQLELRRQTRELRDSEARYRALFENAPDGIVVANTESTYVDGNASICRMLGYTREEFVGLNAKDIVAPTEVRNIEPALTELRAKHDHAREWRFKRKDGTSFTADVTVNVMTDGNLLGMIRDITDRNEAVEALRVAEERMRFTLEATGLGIWEYSYGTQVLQLSETLEAQLGLKAGTFDGTFASFYRYLHPEDRHAMLASVRKAIEAHTEFSVAHRILLPDGTVRWLSGSGLATFDSQGVPVRVVGVSADITERKLLEEQYFQAQKMEAVGRLAGGVAHDFNNLMAAILGYCELLLEEIPADSRHVHDLREIEKAGLRAAGLTRQLLAFSRKQIVEPTVLDLNAVVTDMQSMLARLIGEDITMEMRSEHGLARVKADRGQIEQVVMNLAVNARDAMPDGGTLTIRTANIELDANYPKTHLKVEPGHYVVLTVSDTGTGISAETQKRLFEPFFTTKEVGKGTGLGLATVHGIVKGSGGSVRVYSEVGLGSAFAVYLPAIDAGRVSIEASTVLGPNSGTETVLVVEDEDGVRELVRRLLTQQGYTVLMATNADEALEVFRREPIDALLTDVVMPGGSGPELARSLRQERPDLKVIYMSGYTEDAIVHRGVIGADIDFLHKPFTAASLGRKLREVLDG
ncbi:MAG: PAS domain S-box protein [Gemmatimonadaceae bacterium]